jgi:hypothetical protein
LSQAYLQLQKSGVAASEFGTGLPWSVNRFTSSATQLPSNKSQFLKALIKHAPGVSQHAVELGSPAATSTPCPIVGVDLTAQLHRPLGKSVDTFQDYFERLFQILLMPFVKRGARLIYLAYDSNTVPQKAFEAATRSADGAASLPAHVLNKYIEYTPTMSTQPAPPSEWPAMLRNRGNRTKLFKLLLDNITFLRAKAKMDGVTFIIDSDMVAIVPPELADVDPEFVEAVATIMYVTKNQKHTHTHTHAR